MPHTNSNVQIPLVHCEHFDSKFSHLPSTSAIIIANYLWSNASIWGGKMRNRMEGDGQGVWWPLLIGPTDLISMLMSGNTVNFGSLTASISPNNPIEASKPGDTAEIPTKLGVHVRQNHKEQCHHGMHYRPNWEWRQDYWGSLSTSNES